MDPKISVIIPVRDPEATFPDCLASLRNQTMASGEYEVIVVDDGSQDGFGSLAAEAGARVVHQCQLGPAAARNMGARIARGDLLVFTDADCVPATDFLDRLAASFDDRQVIGAKGAYRSSQDGWVPRFVQAEYEHKYDRMSRNGRIDFVDTYAAAYRREILLENGGFDETFPAPSVEDQELSFRLARKGYRLAFVPDAIVFHRHNEALLTYLRRKFGIGYWKAYMLRWHPDRIASDSHTPLPQRLQVGLAPIALMLATLSPFFPWAAHAGTLALALIMLSAIPEFTSLLKREPWLVPIAPGMILMRAVALASGMLLGAVRQRGTLAGTQWAPLRLRQVIFKRGLDLLVGCAGLALASPLLLLSGLAIKLDSPGPVLFRQERVGEGGRRFRMVKLRTMIQDAERQLGKVLHRNMLQGPAFKIPDDPRVTRVGRFLRRWSLDELPQLWNVVIGEMSVVGPRPEEVRVVEQYRDWHRRRL
ncbi:MAG: sugar transferase, partial [Anaerolineales bacterium]